GTDSDTDGTTDSTTDPTDATDPTDSSTTDPIDPTEDTCGDTGGMGGDIDFSYLWVANTNQGSISKINTVTLIEEARYYSDPNPPAASPSRTSVSISGHYAAVSNRGTGTVSMFAATLDGCVDKNNDGVITTSPDKDTLVPFEEEECRIWTTTVNPPIAAYVGGPRGTTFAPGLFNEGTCEYDAQKLWVGWHTSNGIAYMARIDINSGTFDVTVPVEGWTASHAPYGAALDGQGNVWFTGVFEDHLYRVNGKTFELSKWTSGLGHSPYGMTVDFNGIPWFGGYFGPVAYFDPVTETFGTIPDTDAYHRGIAVDLNYQVWVATNAGGGPGCGLQQVDGETKTLIKNHVFPQCGTPVGVSIDLEGMVWMVDYDGWAWRMDPETEAKDQVLIGGVHYTYSDMTGGALKNVFVPE
ncbi:MAG: lyase, partial [Myxococcales bacterium]|nr:lyase [Myxococcales bacterium]